MRVTLSIFVEFLLAVSLLLAISSATNIFNGQNVAVAQSTLPSSLSQNNTAPIVPGSILQQPSGVQSPQNTTPEEGKSKIITAQGLSTLANPRILSPKGAVQVL